MKICQPYPHLDRLQSTQAELRKIVKSQPFFWKIIGKLMRGFCEFFRFSANLIVQKAKAKRSEHPERNSDAKRSDFASLSLFFAIKRIRNANWTPCTYHMKKDLTKLVFPLMIYLIEFQCSKCDMKFIQVHTLLRHEELHLNKDYKPAKYTARDFSGVVARSFTIQNCERRSQL